MRPNRRALLLVPLLAVAIGFPLSVSAGSKIALFVSLFDGCVSGVGPPNTRITASLRTASPKVRSRDRFRVKTDADGSFTGCFDVPVHGGNSLKLSFAGKEKVIAVPDMWPVIDRVADTIKGRAKPGTDLTIIVEHRKSFKARQQASFIVTADGSGHYEVDTTGSIDLRGLDTVTVLAFRGNNQFAAVAFVPGIVVGRASADVVLAANLGDVTVSLRNRHGVPKGSAHAGHAIGGVFVATMFDPNGAPAYPFGRDRVISDLASDAKLRMPVSMLGGQARNDRITGRCPPNAKYELTVVNFDRGVFEAFYGKADANGDVKRDVGNRMNLRKGDRLTLRCLYPTGDEWVDRDVAL